MKTATIKNTHVATVRKLDLSVMEEVCLILQIKGLEYFHHQYSAYEMFLFVACSQSELKKARYSKIFRGFWINEWAQRNQVFVRVANRRIDHGAVPGSDDIRDLYDFVNSAEYLTNDGEFMKRFGAILQMIQRMEVRS